MKKRHLCFVFAAVLLILFLLAACNTDDAPASTTAVQHITTQASTALGETTTAAKPVKLSMFHYLRQRLSFNMNSSADKVMSAIKKRDIETLESMMCLSIKENEDDLSNRIGNLIDTIDGEILEYTWSQGGSHGESSHDGKILDRQDFSIRVESTEGVYILQITWEIANNFAPEETGICAISVRLQTLVDYKGVSYETYETLAGIHSEGRHD